MCEGLLLVVFEEEVGAVEVGGLEILDDMPRGDRLAGSRRPAEPEESGRRLSRPGSDGFDGRVNIHEVALEPVVERVVASEPLARARVQLVKHSDKVAVWALCNVEGLGNLLDLRSVVLDLVRDNCSCQITARRESSSDLLFFSIASMVVLKQRSKML